MTAGKKAQTATKVARKSVPTAAAGKQSTSTAEQDPDYEPGLCSSFSISTVNNHPCSRHLFTIETIEIHY